MNENYAYTLDVIAPFVRRAIRYQWWFDHPSRPILCLGAGLRRQRDTDERTRTKTGDTKRVETDGYIL